MEYPGGHRFAFTILDDTDDATVENVRPIYELLSQLGLRTTKTVWPVDCPEGSRLFFAGETLQNRGYLALAHELYARGFELASHGATMESSVRSRTLEALAFFEKEFGCLPRVHSNHAQNRENLYWGARRFHSRIAGSAVRAVARLRRERVFQGHAPDSRFFWGDVCQRHFRFVRNFTFLRELNLLKADPCMPYRLAETPWVQHWFSTADAPDARRFVQLLSPQRVDRLVREGGLCIVSTHLGKGFARGGRVEPAVARILEDLASRDGWFVPVSELLEFLLKKRQGGRIPPLGLARLEWRYLLDKLRGERR